MITKYPKGYLKAKFFADPCLGFWILAMSLYERKGEDKDDPGDQWCQVLLEICN